MNKLIFSEGGQPVCLEDLKMLQDNMIELIMSVYPITSGGGRDWDDGNLNVKDLPIYATARHINGSADSNCETVQAHKLIANNTVYDVPETTISESDTDTYSGRISDCYYVLHEETVEAREFEDGTSKPVIKSYTAEIVGHKPHSGEYYAVKDVPSLDELQKKLPARNS